MNGACLESTNHGNGQKQKKNQLQPNKKKEEEKEKKATTQKVYRIINNSSIILAWNYNRNAFEPTVAPRGNFQNFSILP